MRAFLEFAGLLLLLAPVAAVGCASATPASESVPRAVVHEATGPRGLVVATKRPPALRREVRPRRPSSRHVWVGGHWVWHGGRYSWVSGRWVRPPRTRAVWVAGHWTHRPGGWVWVGGHWRG